MFSAGIMHSMGGCDAGEQNALQGKAFLVTFFAKKVTNNILFNLLFFCLDTKEPKDQGCTCLITDT